VAATPRERLSAGAWITLGVVSVLVFFYLLAPILSPFALAAVLAYLLLPGANWLHRHGLPRILACVLMVVLSVAVALGLLLILLPVLEREALALDERLPGLISVLNEQVAPLLQKWLGLRVRFDPAVLRAMALQHVGQQDFVSNVLARFSSGGMAVLGVIGTIVLVPVVLFYLLLDMGPFAQRLEAAIPRRWHDQTLDFLADIDAVLSQFLRGQLTVMLLLAVYYSGALTIAGFDSALPIGLLTGLLIFIPYVGFALGLVLASLVALLQFATWEAALTILGIYGVGYLVESFLLTPRLVGERIGLHPLAVIFALLAFGHIFGFLGVLVALPTSAVLLVALRRVRGRYLASSFYNRP
jgi:predicted PurR-regulated permease PerM